MYKLIASSFCVLLLSARALAEPETQVVRDPTMPLGHVTPSALNQDLQQFTLNSILIGPQRKLAIINGSTLREGQLIPGSANVKVQRISAQAVVLQQAQQTWVLRLSPNIVKRR